MAGSAHSKRIVFSAEPDETRTLGDTARKLRMSKVATLRFAVALLSEMTEQLTHGTRVVLKDDDNREREIMFPQLRVRKRPARK